MPVISLHSNEEYQNLIETLLPEQIMLLDFTASWCGPCQRIAPFVGQLSDKYQDVVMCKVDVDELQDIAQLYKVQAMPTFVFIQDNKVVATFSGANPRKLQDTLKSLLNNNQQSNEDGYSSNHTNY